MKKLNISKGEWVIIPLAKSVHGKAAVWSEHERICHVQSGKVHDANAKLIAEAGTVANQTGKTPRQLLEENRELLEALISAKGLIEQLDRRSLTNPLPQYTNLVKAITNATKQPEQ